MFGFGSVFVIDHHIANLRAHRDEVAARIRAAILQETPAYRNLDTDDAIRWSAGVDDALGMFLYGGIAGRELTDAERMAMEAIGRARAEQDVPLEAIAASIAVAARVVRDWPFLQLSETEGLADDVAQLVVLSERVTTFANKITSAALRAYVVRKEELAASLEQARARLFDRLLSGRFESEATAVREGESLGCDLSVAWAVVLMPAVGEGRALDGLEADALAAVPGSVVVPMGTAATPHEALVVPVVDEEERRRLRGALETLVQTHKTPLLWVGPCVGSRALYRAYQSARALVPHIHRLGTRPALIDLAEFREAALLATVPEEMREAYVVDVLGGIEREPRHRARRLLRTVEVLVHCDSLKAAANALGVNVKTVRRRIERVEQLSGLRLDRPDDLHRARTALTLRTMSVGRTATG